MTTKAALEKLIKIAHAQQKIIEKLAQQAGFQPDAGIATSTADVAQAVIPYLQQAAQAVGSHTPYAVQSANLAENGNLLVSLHLPKDYDPGEYFKLKNKFKELLTGKTLTSPGGTALPVHSVNITGMF